MEVFEFIFYMGVIHIVFSGIWKFFSTIVASLLKELKIAKEFSFLVLKIISYFILVSVSAVITFQYINESPYRIYSVLTGLAGSFIIYTTLAGNLSRNRWRAVMNFERKRVQVMRFDGYLLISFVILYFLILVYPVIGENPVTAWFITVIDRIFRLPVIGIFISIAAMLYMISIIVKGVKTSIYMFSSIVRGVVYDEEDKDSPGSN